MSTQVQPDLNQQTQNQPPAAPPTDNSAAILAQLSQLTQLVSQQQQEIQQLRTVATQPAPQNQLPPITRDEFLDNPNILVDRLAQQMQQQIAPLNDFKIQYQRQQNYLIAKSQVLQQPQFAKFRQYIEPALDNAFAAGQSDANFNNVSGAVQYLIGQLATNNPQLYAQLVGITSTPTIPPVVPSLPATPGAPLPNNQGQPRQLTENELRLARERGMTPEQWLQAAGDGPMIMSR